MTDDRGQRTDDRQTDRLRTAHDRTDRKQSVPQLAPDDSQPAQSTGRPHIVNCNPHTKFCTVLYCFVMICNVMFRNNDEPGNAVGREMIFICPPLGNSTRIKL